MIMHNTLLAANSSFGLSTAADMTHKASRDWWRYFNAQTSSDKRDAAINCAITAWHLIEWVWAAIAVAHRTSPEVSKILGVSGRPLRLEDVRDWALRECPSLEICQAICNGSKHVGSDRSNFSTRMDAPDASQNGTGKEQIANPVVLDGQGNQTEMAKVLSEAVGFWSDQLADRGDIC
jgi:hypothetical protein